MSRILLFFSLLNLLIGHSQFAWGAGGTDIGGGGDNCELSYQSLAREAWEKLEELNPSLPLEKRIDAKKVFSIIKNTDVTCQRKQLTVAGKEKTAVTLSNGKVRVDERRWQKASHFERLRIVIHEALVSLKIEKTGDYHISGIFWTDGAQPFQDYHCIESSESIEAEAIRFKQLRRHKIELQLHRTHTEYAKDVIFGNTHTYPKYNLTLKVNTQDWDGRNRSDEIQIANGLPCYTAAGDSRLVYCQDSWPDSAFVGVPPNSAVLDTAQVFSPRSPSGAVAPEMLTRINIYYLNKETQRKLKALVEKIPSATLNHQTLSLDFMRTPTQTARYRSGCFLNSEHSESIQQDKRGSGRSATSPDAEASSNTSEVEVTDAT